MSVDPILLNQQRLEVLRELALIDSPSEPTYNRLTELASKAVGAPVSLLSMVADSYQFFKSDYGLGEPWHTAQQTPLTHSFCQYVVTSDAPLIVTDARQEPLLKDNLAIPDLDVISYMGMPVTLANGKRLGSFCVIDSVPREWTVTEISIVRLISAIIISEIELRARAKLDPDQYGAKLEEVHATINHLVDDLTTNALIAGKASFLSALIDARARYSI